MVEHTIDKKVTDNYSVVGHAGDFIVVQSLDQTQLRIFHFPNDLLMPHTISIDDKKLNFALSRVDGLEHSFNMIVCTYDAKWNNRCEIYPITALQDVNWLQIDSEYEFDMAEGMCAHSIVMSGEFIVYSCSKMFENGSARKVRVLSLAGRTMGRPVLIAQQETPVDPHVMVSPQDSLRLMKHSATESDVIYSVGSTVIVIKLLADLSNVSWRTSINTLNTCHATTQPLELRLSDSMLIIKQDNLYYRGPMCNYQQEIDPETGLCFDLNRSYKKYYALDGTAYHCDEQVTLVKAWD